MSKMTIKSIFLVLVLSNNLVPISKASVDVYKDGDQSLNVGLFFRADIHDGQGKDDGELEVSSVELHVQAQFTRWLKFKYATEKVVVILIESWSLISSLNRMSDSIFGQVEFFYLCTCQSFRHL